MVNPSLPSPRTWSPDDKVFVPQLRADLANAVALLGQRPYFVGQRSLGDSWSSGADLTLPMDVELTDAWGMHLAPPASGTSTVWAPLPGWYLTDARIPFIYSSSTPAPFRAGFTGTSGGTAFATVYGAASVSASSGGITARAVDLIQLSQAGAPNGSGDFVQAIARQDSGGTLNFNAAPSNLPTLTVRWVCAVTGTQPLPVPPLNSAPSPITAAWLNANLRDAVNFLTYPPVMKAHYTAGSSSLANSSLADPEVVPLTTTDVDTYGALATGANAAYTAPVAGRYLVAGQVNLTASSTPAWYACGIGVNGSATYWGGITRFTGTSLTGGAAVTRRVRLNAGDQVQLIAAQASGGSIAYNTTAANQTRLIALWEGI